VPIAMTQTISISGTFEQPVIDYGVFGSVSRDLTLKFPTVPFK